jgi:D-lactate dehydrogenase (cytochrome)
VSNHRIRARAPKGELRSPALLSDGDDVATYLSDASRYPGGVCPRVYLPRDEAEVAWAVRHETRLLPVGAQSSLTGGATPCGDALLSTARLDRVGELEGDVIRVGAGVALLTLEETLRELGAYYPPAPTYTGAFVGGVVSTNAAGAATWKYGTTRDWVDALTVVIPSGDVLDLTRGQVAASPEGTFEVELPDGQVLTVPVPSYTMPDVPKRSAGYHAEPGMDLVDLFVGSEGTLGVVVEVGLRVLRDPPQVLAALLTFASEAKALEVVAELRQASQSTWKTKDPAGLDVRSIESMDRRCLELLRADGQDAANAVELPAEAETALIVQVELPPGVDADEALASYGDDDAAPTGVSRFLDLLERHDALDTTEVALPNDRARQAQLYAVREAVPMAVNHRVEQAKREVDGRIHKVGGDMIVPFEAFGEMMALYRQGFAERGLDGAIWGHISDGNVHPNVIPTSHADVDAGHEALLAFGREVARLGGCPLSEHGTGRNPVKQALLHQLYGDEGIEQMRRIKAALDPQGKLAPGVIFPEARARP